MESKNNKNKHFAHSVNPVRYVECIVKSQMKSVLCFKLAYLISESRKQ